MCWSFLKFLLWPIFPYTILTCVVYNVVLLQVGWGVTLLYHCCHWSNDVPVWATLRCLYANMDTSVWATWGSVLAPMTVFTCNWPCCDNTKYKDYKCHGNFCSSFVEGHAKTLNSSISVACLTCVSLRVRQTYLILRHSTSCVLWKSNTQRSHVSFKSFRKRASNYSNSHVTTIYSLLTHNRR